jgi:hypothetical protein
MHDEILRLPSVAQNDISDTSTEIVTLPFQQVLQGFPETARKKQHWACPRGFNAGRERLMRTSPAAGLAGCIRKFCQDGFDEIQEFNRAVAAREA